MEQTLGMGLGDALVMAERKDKYVAMRRSQGPGKDLQGSRAQGLKIYI